MKTILITGSNGFIGKYIKEFNQFKDYELIYGTTSKVDNDLSYVKFDKLYQDINEILKNKNKNIDIIIHCASIIPNSFDSSDKKLFFDNMKMMTNLYEFSIKENIIKFIYSSSFGSIQNVREYDIKDYYTLSKITGEHMCSMMRSKGIQTASLRISSPFGEFYNKYNVLSLFIDLALQNKTISIYGSGGRKQNFVYVGNIMKYIECRLENNISGIYDVVSSEDIPMKGLAEMIIKLTDSKSTIKLGELKDPNENIKLPVYDLEKSKSINYIDKYSFEDSLNKYIIYRKSILKK